LLINQSFQELANLAAIACVCYGKNLQTYPEQYTMENNKVIHIHVTKLMWQNENGVKQTYALALWKYSML
jgi:hypothetical protein